MNQPGELQVGVLGGTRLPGNVRTFLQNIRAVLQNNEINFNLELIATDEISAPDGFKQIDPGFDSSDRALGTLRTLVRRVTDYADQREIDVLFQVTKFPLHGSAATLAGWRTDTPVLTRLAGDNFQEFRFSSGIDTVKTFGINNVIGRIPVHLSDQIIVLGPHGRTEIRSRNDDVPVIEIPQPVNRDRFNRVSKSRERELARAFDFPQNKRVFLTVGRLTERKGMSTIIRTARQLHSRGRSFRWYVIGDGPMYRKLSTTRGVEPLGRVGFEMMADYYRAVDLVVHPSLIEGLPNVLLEAAACGTPTVARDVGDSSMVASAVFDMDEELPELLMKDVEPVTLGQQFAPDRLGSRYADTLVETAECS